MNGLWTLLVFWAGVAFGFGVFAMLQVSRDSEEASQRALLSMLLARG
jgi:hypothetical protein